MSVSCTTTTTTRTSSTAGPSRSRPVAPLPADTSVHEEEGLEDEDEDEIIQRAQARVERVRARKVAAAAKKAAEEKAARAAAARERAAQEVQEQALWARQQEEEVVERRRLLAEVATARSQRGTLPSEMSVSPRRPVVEIRREKGKGKAKVPAQPVGGDPDDGDEEKEPCERCRAKKIPCLQQAGKRSSMILKREGGSGEQIAVMESQMAQSLANLRALWEANSKSHQYLRQLLRRQEDDHARLIAMETKMVMKVEESAEEEEEEEEKEVEKKEDKVEKDGEGEEEMAPTEAQSEKGKERAE
ncbi:hypothetical protein LENED_012536 [Lentinula edodes]|uniref:Uncharacterized protein n=1 Tax=Lentinula edodes TaxID=5353 RepID=A0A1Q3ESX4_LENED|nr:hypothetical protein LENED_012536 [Lentinula edodes]